MLITLLSTAALATQPALELWIIPHSHADVGWLQTVNSLQRVNVSRILDTVVAALQAEPSRKFLCGMRWRSCHRVGVR